MIAQALDVGSILAIHRAPDGYVAFARKPLPADRRLGKNGKPYTFEHLFSIRSGELRDMFPALSNWLTQDSYVSVNSFYRAAPWANRTTGLPEVWRSENCLRYLTALYCDVDSGRGDSDEPGGKLDWRQAQHKLERLADAGKILQPSIMARSGRGLYALWLLCAEDDPSELQKAWRERIVLYKKLNAGLVERLRRNQLPADKNALDAARVLRVPGSVHTVAHRTVKYVIQLDAAGRGFVYRMSEVAAFLGISAPGGELPEGVRTLAKPVQYRKTQIPGSAPGRKEGCRKMHALRASDMLVLQAWRGGFLKRGSKHPDGSTSPGRRFLLTLYAGFLRGSGATRSEILDAAVSMAANCRPRYPSDSDDVTCETIIADAFLKRRRWTNEKLCAIFGVTADMADALELQTIRPISMRDTKPLRANVIGERLAFVRQYVERNGVPDCRRLARVLYANGFSKSATNQNTANQILNELGYVTQQRRQAGRPRKVKA